LAKDLSPKGSLSRFGHPFRLSIDGYYLICQVAGAKKTIVDVAGGQIKKCRQKIAQKIFYFYPEGFFEKNVEGIIEFGWYRQLHAAIRYDRLRGCQGSIFVEGRVNRHGILSYS
jgi:hypothetical protein